MLSSCGFKKYGGERAHERNDNIPIVRLIYYLSFGQMGHKYIFRHNLHKIVNLFQEKSIKIENCNFIIQIYSKLF